MAPGAAKSSGGANVVTLMKTINLHHFQVNRNESNRNAKQSNENASAKSRGVVVNRGGYLYVSTLISSG